MAFMLLPSIAVIGGLFAGGFVLVLAQSLGYFSPTGENSFTLAHYRRLLFDPEFLASLRLTFALASVATVISAVAGLALALALRELATRSSILGALLQVPLAVPHLAMAVVLINLIAPSGLFARIAYALGLINAPAEFPALIGDRYGLGIIIVYVLKETPFVALMALALLVRLGEEYEQVARTLGAPAWQRLRYVTVPLVAPAVVSSSLVVFAFIFGAFETPFILGRPYPAMLAVVAQRRFTSSNLADRPDGIAVAVVLTLVAVLLIWLYGRLARILVGIERPSVF
ncbi:MAG: ABC transporter permease subunit [Acidobacteria bacterium]|nr:ABC transporter permease subunit [Acidobacteriota bacterium]